MKQIKNGDILLTYIGMLCQGKPQYEAVREMMDDPDYYKYALGIAYAIPSAETFRQRFDMIGDTLRKDILQANVDMFREMSIEPSVLLTTSGCRYRNRPKYRRNGITLHAK